MIASGCGVQYSRELPASAERLSQAAPTRRLCVGNVRTAGDRRRAAGSDADPLLARHSLELALNVGEEQPSYPDPLLVVIFGPTASGKTALSLALAEKFSGEIVNCDSVAMYREFDIGTAKPNADEQRQAPHHLFDCVEPTREITAGDYARQARQVLAEIGARKHLPIVVGGTGLYLRALLEGLFPGPQRSEELRTRLRERAARHGSEYLHKILRRLDADAAGRIHPNDAPKLIRAIEVCLAARQKLTDLWREGREPLRGFRILRLGLDPDRTALYERINERAQGMFDNGLIEETERLLSKYGDRAKPLSSLGYRQAAQYIRGELTRDQAMATAQQGHRNYAKRQMTWFRREPDVLWLKGFGDNPAIQLEAIYRVREITPAPAR